MARSVKIAALEVVVGDVVLVAAADDVEEGVEPPLALLQALWQTAKGEHTAFCIVLEQHCWFDKLPIALLATRLLTEAWWSLDTV